jgi:hypothetical protein
MSNKKQTAVEWLVSHLNKQEWFTFKQNEYIEQAKAMEKEQIIDAYYEGKENGFKEQFDQYYKETYENSKNY